MLIMSFMFSTYRDPYPSEQLSRVVDVVAVGYSFLFWKTSLIHLQQQVCGAVSKRRFKTDLQLGPLNFVQKIPFSMETGVSIGVQLGGDLILGITKRLTFLRSLAFPVDGKCTRLSIPKDSSWIHVLYSSFYDFSKSLSYQRCSATLVPKCIHKYMEASGIQHLNSQWISKLGKYMIDEVERMVRLPLSVWETKEWWTWEHLWHKYKHILLFKWFCMKKPVS